MIVPDMASSQGLTSIASCILVVRSSISLEFSSDVPVVGGRGVDLNRSMFLFKSNLEQKRGPVQINLPPALGSHHLRMPTISLTDQPMRQMEMFFSDEVETYLAEATAEYVYVLLSAILAAKRNPLFLWASAGIV